MGLWRGQDGQTPSSGFFPSGLGCGPSDLAAARRAPDGRLRSLRRLFGARLGLQLVLGILLLGPLLAAIAYDSTSHHQEFATEQAFRDVLADRVHELDAEFRSFGEVLHSCRGLFEASERVTRAEFARFTREARERHPAVLEIGWAPRVTERGRGEHQEAARREGLGEYRITARGPGRSMEPAPPSEELFPVLYVEPMAGNAAMLGFDLASDGARGRAIRRAFETARFAASEPLDLLGRSEGGPGAILALGLYDRPGDGVRPGDVPVGVLYLAFQFADVLREVRSGARAGAWSRIDLAWSDRSVGGRPRLVGPLERDIPARAEAPYAAEQRLPFAGRDYLVRATPTDLFLSEHQDSDPLLVATLVLVAWELFGAGLYALARSWRTRALERQARAVGLVLRSLAEGVVIADREGRVQLANDAALGVLGASIDDLRSPEWPTRCGLVHADGRTPCEADRVPLARAARGEVVAEEEFWIERRPASDGLRVAATARPLVDGDNVLQGGVMVLRDVTSQRRLHEAEIEMRLASEVQQRLYPRAAPLWEGLDVAGADLPAVATSGDYYDYVRFADGSFVLVIGDVSGHGLGPALVMAETRAYVRSLSDAGVSPDEILRRVNAHLRGDLAEGVFVTLLLVTIDPRTRRLSHASAGHTPALLLDASGAVKARLGPTGPALGVYDRPPYGTAPGPTMDAGDVLVLLTDGVSECANPDGALLEEEGVVEVLRGCCGEDARTILARVEAAVDAFTGGGARQDDITIVVCRAVLPIAEAESPPAIL